MSACEVTFLLRTGWQCVHQCMCLQRSERGGWPVSAGAYKAGKGQWACDCSCLLKPVDTGFRVPAGNRVGQSVYKCRPAENTESQWACVSSCLQTPVILELNMFAHVRVGGSGHWCSQSF